MSTLHRNRAPLRALLMAAVLGLTVAGAPAVGAEAEWEDNSPPPLDFGLQQTAEPSGTAPYVWLRSTKGGDAVYDTWSSSGVDPTLLEGVSGGVATGMTTAIYERLGAR